MKTELFGTLIIECQNYPPLKRKRLVITLWGGGEANNFKLAFSIHGGKMEDFTFRA